MKVVSYNQGAVRCTCTYGNEVIEGVGVDVIKPVGRQSGQLFTDTEIHAHQRIDLSKSH